ncbi:MAG: hypothetical protein JOS17DRAFT_129484 [Linnemannia elongata]|nr:MAG: hypothetical protein JOS17DRAFT_129484 [Linnemannia elongata]
MRVIHPTKPFPLNPLLPVSFYQTKVLYSSPSFFIFQSPSSCFLWGVRLLSSTLLMLSALLYISLLAWHSILCTIIIIITPPPQMPSLSQLSIISTFIHLFIWRLLCCYRSFLKVLVGWLGDPSICIWVSECIPYRIPSCSC